MNLTEAGCVMHRSHKSVRECRRERAFAEWTLRSHDKHKEALSDLQQTTGRCSEQKSQRRGMLVSLEENSLADKYSESREKFSKNSKD